MRSRLSTKAGLAVRRLRLAKGMTLAELSERSSVPLSSLSKLELGQLSLTYDKLMRISRALDADFGYILQNDADAVVPRGRRELIRAGAGARTRWGPHAALVSAPDLLSKSFLPVVLEVKARTAKEHGPFTYLGGEAYLLVLEGELTLHLESYAPLAMTTGDGIYFDGRGAHMLLTGGPKPAKALLIAPPEEAAFSLAGAPPPP